MRGAEGRLPRVYGGSKKKLCECVCGVGRGGHSTQLPPINPAVLWSVCYALREQTDGRAHGEAGSMRRRLKPLHRQQRQAEGHPKAA